MSEIYQKCVVAFVDLLGFKQALNNPENAKGILEILQQIKQGEKSNCSAKTEIIGSVTEIQITPTVSAFSDNIVISISEKLFEGAVSWRHAVIEILNIIQQLANLVIQKGFLLRGGITVGDLYHEKGIVFGPALVHAYHLESKEAVFPRVLASQELVDCFNSDKNGGTTECFIEDDKERYYLDYLPVALTHSCLNQTYQNIIQEKILQLMKAASYDERAKKILAKWFWFEKYHLETINRIALPDTIIEDVRVIY